MEENEKIREELRKYKISYAQLLKYMPNFSHVQRISEELAKPLNESREKEYLIAIQKVKDERIKKLEEK